jgi:hypothetical protein
MLSNRGKVPLYFGQQFNYLCRLLLDKIHFIRQEDDL